jgi:phosphoadenosine phosphosulfate reductase
MSRLNKSEVASLASNYEEKSCQEVLRWALETFHPKIALASSFGNEDIVLIDMLCKIRSKPRVFTLDTGRLHQDTYNLMDSIKERYGIEIEVYFPETKDVEEMVRKHGLNLFYRSVELRLMCCEIRKTKLLKRALLGLDAWITGLRREQSPTRAHIKKVEIDEAHSGIVKVNPMADWTSEQVWRYIRENNLPYNRLYDKGYASIGCVPCTRPIKPGEDPRTGRWWWERKGVKECGLHYQFEDGKKVLKMEHKVKVESR